MPEAGLTCNLRVDTQALRPTGKTRLHVADYLAVVSRSHHT